MATTAELVSVLSKGDGSAGIDVSRAQLPPPRVSVGLPVYNGENFVAEAIECHLEQSFADFELIICDNASTDETQAICARYAAQDRRIRYVRFDRNVGAAANFNRTFQLARGDYFRWAAHDDRIQPAYLERCVAILDGFPDVVLCHSDVRLISHKGTHLDIQRLPKTSYASDVVTRFREMADMEHQCLDVFGLIRRTALQHTPLIAGYLGADRNLLAELALHGRFYRLSEPLFESRVHPGRSICQDEKTWAEWFSPDAAGSVPYAHWINLKEYARSLRRAPAPLDRRLACTRVLAGWALDNSRELGVEAVRTAVQQALGLVRRR